MAYAVSDVQKVNPSSLLQKILKNTHFKKEPDLLKKEVEKKLKV